MTKSGIINTNIMYAKWKKLQCSSADEFEITGRSKKFDFDQDSEVHAIKILLEEGKCLA